MARIGSRVIWMGEVWKNLVINKPQPVWGVKKSSADDEETLGVMTEKKKSFAEYLKDALENAEKC